jgi:hypothetical protein
MNPDQIEAILKCLAKVTARLDAIESKIESIEEKVGNMVGPVSMITPIGSCGPYTPNEVSKTEKGLKCDHPEHYLMLDHECEACRVRRSKQKYICPYCDGNHKDCSSS